MDRLYWIGYWFTVTHSRKFTCLFALGMGCIASTYALGLHFFWKNAPYSASISAVLGSLFLSFVIWWLLYEKRGERYVSGVVLGALSGSVILLLGPIGFYIGVAIEEPGTLRLSYIPFVLTMSGIAFPLVLLAMHGWTVVLGSVIWGRILESLEQRKQAKAKREA